MQTGNDEDPANEPGDGKPETAEDKKKSFQYFVNGTKYVSDASNLTGAQIKARIANFDPSYQLVEEGQGDDPDKIIQDNETVSLTPPPPRFYTVPPANFG